MQSLIRSKSAGVAGGRGTAGAGPGRDLLYIIKSEFLILTPIHQMLTSFICAIGVKLCLVSLSSSTLHCKCPTRVEQGWVINKPTVLFPPFPSSNKERLSGNKPRSRRSKDCR